MCTALSLTAKDGSHLFGRNMDIEYSFNQSILLTPRRFDYKNRATGEMNQTKYAVIGMGTIIDEHPCYAELFNEKGLAAAGLNFPNYAHWDEKAIEGKTNIPPYDLVLWVTANFETVQEVKEALKDVVLVDVPVNEQTPIAPLHWMICDKTGESIVVEKTVNGLSVMDNKVGVLTNAPTFDWHLTNLTQYMGLTPTQPKDTTLGEQELHPLGQGLGAFSLPGDYSSPSRFVKAAFLRNNIDYANVNYSGISEFFHILNGVAMIRGSVVTPQHLNDITLYTSCMDQERGIYYYNTYTNHTVSAINMHNEDLDAKEIKSFKFNDEFAVTLQN